MLKRYRDIWGAAFAPYRSFRPTQTCSAFLGAIAWGGKGCLGKAILASLRPVFRLTTLLFAAALLSACSLLGQEEPVLDQRQMAIAEPDSDFCCSLGEQQSESSLTEERIRRWSEEALESADEDRQMQIADNELPNLRGSITTGNTRYHDRHAVIRRHEEVANPPVFVLMNDTWLTARAANLRAEPQADAMILSSWPRGRRFHLVGHIPGSDWYLVGEWGRLAGYINGRLLKPLPRQEHTRLGLVAANLLGSQVNPGEVLVEVSFEQRCRDQLIALHQISADPLQRRYTACEALEGGWHIVSVTGG